MSCLLCIDTSTDVCSVALCRDGIVLFDRADHSGPNHAERLGAFVDEAMGYADGHGVRLEAVAVSGGPGSYTGLRIGVSMGKGLCYGRDLKLVAVPTLEVLAAAVLPLLGDMSADTLLCPMIDARRMEVYAAVYDRSLAVVRGISADVVDEFTYKTYLDEQPMCFFGNGAAKCMDTINHPNARLIKGVEPLAVSIMPGAERRMASGEYADVAYYEPFYLKEFVAGKPKMLLSGR